jgi:cell surface protein SprA
LRNRIHHRITSLAKCGFAKFFARRLGLRRTLAARSGLGFKIAFGLGMAVLFSMTQALPILAGFDLRAYLERSLHEAFKTPDAQPLPPVKSSITLRLLPVPTQPLPEQTAAISSELDSTAIAATPQPDSVKKEIRIPLDFTPAENPSVTASRTGSAFGRVFPKYFYQPSFIARELGLDYNVSDSFDAFFAPPDSDDVKKKIRPTAADSSKRLSDSLATRKDTIAIAKPDTAHYNSPLDSLYRNPIDSTDRLQNFPYKLSSTPYTPVIVPKVHPFFIDRKILEPQRSVELDSTGRIIRIRESIDGTDVRPAVQMSLSDYKKYREKDIIRHNFEEMVYATRPKNLNDPIADMLSKISKISIYIPGAENSIFSTIFGPPTVSLQVAGAIDVNFAYQVETTSDPLAAQTGGNTRSDPAFNQQIQMNITGTIGDKLTILADWNTQRQFDYENQLKIKYTGYQDEIVQSIEAGNVSLTTPTTFIGSSQALFGLKANLQVAGLSLTTIAAQKKGKAETISVSGGTQQTAFNVRAWNYVIDTHYFITNYATTQWDNAHSNPLQPTAFLPVSKIDVWITTQRPDKNQRPAIALIDLGDARDTTSQAGGFPPPSIEINNKWGTNTDVLNHLRDSTSSLPPLLAADPYYIANRTYVINNFVKLTEGTDYIVDRSFGYITMIRPINNQAIAVAYQYTLGGQSTIIGDLTGTGQQINTNNKILLKLLRPAVQTNQLFNNRESWNLMLKNIYSIGGRGIKQDGFSAKIIYENYGGAQAQLERLPFANDGKSLLTLLGLDRLNSSDAPQPDNALDFKTYVINVARGEIIFPYLRPFDTPIRQEAQAAGLPTDSASAYIYSAVYDTTNDAAQSSGFPQNRYVLLGSFKSDVASTYQLGANIVQGSVKVSAGGITFVEGTDYTVDYQVGQVVIRNEAALKPGANLTINYEKNDLLSIASKSLIGTRAEYTFSDQFKIGGTWLQYSETPLSEKIRVGDEPVLNSIYGFDGQYSTKSKLLTKFVDALPLVSTKAESEFFVRAEYAKILPSHPTALNNPSTGDPNGVSYIDDFEGSKKTTQIGSIFTNWALASPPQDKIGPISADSVGTYFDSTRTNYKGWIDWFNIESGDGLTELTANVLLPNSQLATDQQLIKSFNIEFFPNQRGQYNYSRDLQQTVFNSPENSWGGFMRHLPTFATNLFADNVEFFEFWVKASDDAGNPTVPKGGGYMHVDLGYISEDVIPDGQLHTEDGLLIGNGNGGFTYNTDTDEYGRLSNATTRSGSLTRDPSGQPTEDVGLDGLPNQVNASSPISEATVFADFINKAQTQFSATRQGLVDSIMADPSGDDYYSFAQKNSYRYINGTDGNSPVNGSYIGSSIYPDTEDLNGNSILDTRNSYYSYRIKIDPDSLNSTSPVGQFVAGGGQGPALNNGWVLIRVPLKDFYKKVETGGPITDFTDIEYVRVWFNGFKAPMKIRMANFEFIGSQWAKTVQDSSVSSSIVSIEENSATYASPPGVTRARDLTRPDQNVLANEQSLVIKVNNVLPQDSRGLIRQYSAAPLNLNPYKKLKMFVHGSSNFKYRSATSFDAQAYIRFGLPDNYYEYRVPIHPSPANFHVSSTTNPSSADQAALWPSQNNIEIDLQALTSLKQTRPAGVTTPIIEKNPAGSQPGTVALVVGNPSLDQIRFISIGVFNPSLSVNDTVRADSINSVVSKVSHPSGYHDFGISGEIWVDELRVSDYQENSGWAAKAEVGIKLADLAQLNFSIQRTTQDFHSLYTRLSASNANTTDWSAQGSFNLDKFLPAEQGWRIPLTVGHSEAVSDPKYLPGNQDILLTAAANRVRTDSLLNPTGSSQVGDKLYNDFINSKETVSVTDRYSTSIQKTTPSDYWLNRFTIDRVKFSYDWTKSHSRDPNTQYANSWQWDAALNYSDQQAANATFYIQPFKGFADVPILKEYKDLKLYYLPQSYAWNVALTEQRARRRGLDAPTEDPITRSFSSTRSFGFQYKVTDTFDMSYASSIDASLDDIDYDSTRQVFRSNGQIAKILLQQLSSFDLGRDRNYNQTITLAWRPKILSTFNFMELAFNYTARYQWTSPVDPNVRISQGTVTGTTGDFRIQSTFKAKQFFEKIGFSRIPNTAGQPTPDMTVPRIPEQPLARHENIKGQNPFPSDTTGLDNGSIPNPNKRPLPSVVGIDTPKGLDTVRAKTPQRDTTSQTSSESPFKQLGRDLRSVLIAITSFENVSANYGYSNHIDNNGVDANSGWLNVFPFNVGFVPGSESRRNSPSFGYQFGTSANPGNRISNSSLLLLDRLSQTNTLDFATAFTPVENIRIDLTARTSWTYSRENQITQGLSNTSGSVTRSTIALFSNPDPQNFLKYIQTGGINQLDNATLANGFQQAFEPIGLRRTTQKILGLGNRQGEVIPMPNWRITWSGLEKSIFFDGVASSVSLEHAYSAEYSSQFTSVVQQANVSGIIDSTATPTPVSTSDRQYTSLRVSEQFQPLIGISINWIFGVTTQIRYNLSNTYSLGLDNASLDQSKTSEIAVTIGYAKSGLKIPLRFWPFNGATLENNLDVSFTFSYATDVQNSTKFVDNSQGGDAYQPIPPQGSTRLTYEPRIKYTLSSRVDASFFWTHTQITPTVSSSTVYASSKNAIGLSFHISIGS